MPQIHQSDNDIGRVQTLGSVRLHHADTNEVLLVPEPSSDLNDPLNWSKKFRWYIATITCFAIFLAQFLAAGPSVAMVDIVIDYFGTPPSSPGWLPSLSKASYLFTTLSFIQGMSNLVYMPLIIKYGRRPVYLISFLAYGACALWAGRATSFGSHLAARLCLGFAGGSAECLAPLTIADTFFLHERGIVMVLYSASLACGICLGIVISGFITITQSWRVIYYLAVGMIWGLVILIYFTMPETSYRRVEPISHAQADAVKSECKDRSEFKDLASHIEIHPDLAPPARKSYSQKLAIFTGKYTNESILKMAWRPVVLVFLPPVLWATLVMSAIVGCFVALSSNYATAFSEVYGWVPWQCGLTYLSVMIGALLGVLGGGWFSDYTADWLTKRNNGVREPEMRLPTIMLSTIATPVAMIMYGVGLGSHTHWIVPVMGMGFMGFSLTQSTNIVLVYVVDAYRPIAGEAIVSQLAFKAALGFLFSFYTNNWIADAGYIGAFGALAAANALIFLAWIPFYIWGKKIRHLSIQWPLFRHVRWDVDREVGE